MTREAAIDRNHLAQLIATERDRYRALHTQCAAAGHACKSHFLYGVPMHWMNDWGTPSPLFVDHAHDVTLCCPDGIDHIDFCLADTAAMFGHSPQALVDAIALQAAKGLGAMLPGTQAAEAGRLLSERFGLPVWQMALSASDANRFCLRWARAVTGRQRIVVFDGCYHGTVDDVFVDRVQTPHGIQVQTRASLLGQIVDLTRTTRVVPFNDRQALASALADGTVACVIAEPVMTNVGMVLPDPGFLEFLQEECRRHGTLLLLDETHTLSSAWNGYARSGGLEPDILVLGKAIAGGVPCAVYGVTRQLATRMQQAKDQAPPGHSGVGTTLSGNLLGLAALCTTLNQVATPTAYDHMLARAVELEDGLRRVIADAGLPWCVTRVGARCEFQFCPQAPRTGQEARDAMDDELEGFIHLYLMNRGVLITPFHNMMLCSPATRSGHVQAFLTTFSHALKALVAPVH
jgi:glutamate-1-semialdehyde 2,1-aminomutase